MKHRFCSFIKPSWQRLCHFVTLSLCHSVTAPRSVRLRRTERGDSMLEMLLVIALVMAMAPYMYYRISETGRDVSNLAVAKRIPAYGAPIMNYVRLNQDLWTPAARIKMTAEELNQILADANDTDHGPATNDQRPTTNDQRPILLRQGYSGQGLRRTSDQRPPTTDQRPTTNDPLFSLSGAFINKYKTANGSAFDIYLQFKVRGSDEMRNVKIAKMIGSDAGIARDGAADGVYGNWSASSEIFEAGNIVYRISENLAFQDSERFLHRTVLGEEKLNSMLRPMSLGGHTVYNIGAAIADSIRVADASALFADASVARATELQFPSGANLDPSGAMFGSVRVLGDITGFRNIAAGGLSGRGAGTWARQGSVIADKAAVSDSVHVGGNLYVKSDVTRTISGFSGLVAHSVYVPFLSTQELAFLGGFGLTVSSELMMSGTDSPLKLGSWIFPSLNMPKLNGLVLHRFGGGDIAAAAAISQNEFKPITDSGWKEIRPPAPQVTK